MSRADAVAPGVGRRRAGGGGASLLTRKARRRPALVRDAVPFVRDEEVCWNRVMEIPGLLEVAEVLYAGSLDGFTAARNARAAAAKKAGERALSSAITSLKKPSSAAWAANLLVRASPAAIVGLSELREAIAQASAAGDRDALKDLSSRRQAVIADLVGEARDLARSSGKDLSSASADELADALGAALADEDVTAALATGRLVLAPQPGGMTRRDLAAIVAVTPDDLFPDAEGEDEYQDEDEDEDEDDVDVGAPRRSGATTTRRSSGAATRGRQTDRRVKEAGSAERRRVERDLRAAEGRAAEARADREKREGERDALAATRDELAADVTRQREALHVLERRLDEAEEVVSARTADIRARELEWKRAEAAVRSARRALEGGTAP